MLDLRPIDRRPEGIAAVHALLQEVFPAATYVTPEYLDWQYNANPVGPVIGWDAVDDGRLVGHYATLPVAMRLFGERVVGAHIVNLAVLPAYRGRRLMTELGNRSHQSAREQGLACEWGVSNANSTHGHHVTFGFQHVCVLEARLGVGRVPARRARDDAPTLQFERVWDRESVRWRLSNPSLPYALVPRDGRLEVRAPAGRPGVDAVLGDVDRADAPEGRRRTPRPLRIWLGVDPARDWSRSLYWNLPPRLRPAPLNLMFKDLTGAGRQLDPTRVRMDALDFDAY